MVAAAPEAAADPEARVLCAGISGPLEEAAASAISVVEVLPSGAGPRRLPHLMLYAMSIGVAAFGAQLAQAAWQSELNSIRQGGHARMHQIKDCFAWLLARHICPAQGRGLCI